MYNPKTKQHIGMHQIGAVHTKYHENTKDINVTEEDKGMALVEVIRGLQTQYGDEWPERINESIVAFAEIISNLKREYGDEWNHHLGESINALNITISKLKSKHGDEWANHIGGD